MYSLQLFFFKKKYTWYTYNVLFGLASTFCLFVRSIISHLANKPKIVCSLYSMLYLTQSLWILWKKNPEFPRKVSAREHRQKQQQKRRKKTHKQQLNNVWMCDLPPKILAHYFKMHYVFGMRNISSWRTMQW